MTDEHTPEDKSQAEGRSHRLRVGTDPPRHSGSRSPLKLETENSRLSVITQRLSWAHQSARTFAKKIRFQFPDSRFLSRCDFLDWRRLVKIRGSLCDSCCDVMLPEENGEQLRLLYKYLDLSKFHFKMEVAGGRISARRCQRVRNGDSPLPVA